MVRDLKSFSLTKLPQIFFGSGSISKLEKLACDYGNNVLLVTGNHSFDAINTEGKLNSMFTVLKNKIYRQIIEGEPSPKVIDEATSAFRDKKIDVVIAIGGGSVLDAGKAIAVMLVSEGSVRDYLEGVGNMSPSGIRLPLIAVPTSSGTGSEATNNAVISEFGKNGFKKSLRHIRFVPDYALVDPELAVSCPKNITAASGMDAFTQLLESYISAAANPFIDMLAVSGLECIARSLKMVYHHGNDLTARNDMAYAALISGITLSNAGLGVIHGFAQPLGSLFPIPHGIVCGSLMGSVNRFTIEKLKRDKQKTIYLEKYAGIGRLFSTNKSMKSDYYIDLLLDTIDQTIDEFQIPSLSYYGVKESDLESIIQQTGHKNHPVEFSNEELKDILRKRL